MRHRTWVVVLAVLVIAVLPLSFIGLRIASRHPSVKHAVLTRIVPRTAERLSIGELEIGLASLRLGDVALEIGDVAVVNVPEASVSISYKRLLTNGFELRRSLSTVIISDPTVTITIRRAAEGEGDGGARPVDLAGLADVLPDYLGVSGGTLVLEDPATSRSVRIDSIALLVENADRSRIEGSATGSGFGGVRNVRSELMWDGALAAGEVTVDLTDADFGRGLALPGAPFDVTAGRATATAALSVDAAGIERASVGFAVRAGRVLLPGELGVLDRASISGSYDGRTAAFVVDQGRWQGAGVRAEGSIDVPERSIESLEVTGTAVPLDRLAECVGADPTVFRGRADVAAAVHGPIDAPAVSASVVADSVRIAEVAISDLASEIAYSDGLVRLDSFVARALGGAVEGLGQAMIGAGGAWTFDVHCDADGVSARAVSELLGGPEARGELEISGVEVRGTPAQPELEALVRWRDAGVGPVDLGDGAGGVILRDGTLFATAASKDASYSAAAEVSGFFSDPSVAADVTLSGLAADSILGSGGPAIPVRLDGGIELAGPIGALDVEGHLAARGEALSATLALDGTLSGGPRGMTLRLSVDSDDAVLRGAPVPFSSSLAIDGSELVVSSLEVAGVLRARLGVGLGSDHPLEGSLVVSEAELGHVLRAATGIESGRAEGLVFASGSVTGTLDDPSATLQLQVGSGRLAGVGGLDGALLATLDGRRVEVREVVVSQGGRPFVTASGDIDLQGDVALTVRGDGIPGPLLGGGEDSRFDLTLGLGGRRDNPTLDGRIESSGGVFLRIPYDEFVARVTGAEGVIRVEPLALERSDSYRLSASARVPYAALSGEGEAEGSLSVEVDGDPLAFLAELTPLIDSASGSGYLGFDLVGRRGEVTVASGELQATASSVEPSILFEELSDVEVSVTVSDEAVREGSVSARVDGDPILLRSVREVPAALPDPGPLSIGGVDVGILALSTGADGVRASVPGLMLPEDVGRVALRGKEDGPALLISSRAGCAFLWGEVEFSDMTFTYPFADSGADAWGGFLSDAEWSLSMVAGRNVWYWRPDANLRVEAGGSLDFAGVPSEGGLCVSGRVESSKGTITYLDTDFDTQKAFVDFPPFCEPPRLYVEASTRVEDGTTVTLTMDAFERALAFAARGATIDESALTLSSDSPDDNTEEKIVSKLSYGLSYDSLEGEEQASMERRRAIEVIGTQISGRVVRPLLSPIEGRLKRSLNLDLVRFEVDFVEHFLAELDQWSAQGDGGEYQPFLADTRVTLGKYISSDWLLSYVGIAEAFEQDIGDQQLGIRHELGIEYEVSQNTSLSLKTVYDPSLAGWDRRVSIENRYDF